MKNSRIVHIPKPPDTPRRPVVDNVHGTIIEDPYRWLEDGQSPETVQWTKAQNERTETVLSQLPERKVLQNRLKEILSQDTVGSPVLRGKKIFYTRRKQGANQPVLCVRELEGATSERILLDPNKASEKGIVALDWWYPSPDGSMLAYGYSERGDEWSILHVLNVETGEILPDTIERTRGAGVAWKKDNRSFYYGRYPKPGEVPPGEENYHKHIFHHTLGEDPSQDPKVFGEGRPKEEMFSVRLSDDGRYLLLNVSHGWNSSDIYFRDETKPKNPFVPVIVGEDAIFHGAIVGNTLYMLTNYKAPRYRLVAVDLNKPQQENWKEIIPENPDMTLVSFQVVKDHIVVAGLRDAVSHLYVYDMEGNNEKEIPLPTIGTVGQLSGEPSNPDIFFVFQSFALTPAIYRFNVEKDKSPQLFLSGTQLVRPDSIQVKQIFYTSKDGTRVPMFILHKKDCRSMRFSPIQPF